MTRRWWRRSAVVACSWALTVGVMAAVDMNPRPIPLAGIAVAIAAIMYLLFDLADIAAPASWYAPRDNLASSRGADVRVRSLHRQLVRSSSDTTALHSVLVGVIDAQLRTAHAVDRSQDPARAAMILGPELHELVSGPAPAALADPAHLSTILSRIEAL